jgi:dephospho-CoA kinase
VLRVGLTGPSERAVAVVAATWAGVARDVTSEIVVGAVEWTAPLDVAARHHLVVGVAPASANDGVDVWVAPDGAATLLRDRLEPFATNLAAGRRAPRRRVARLVESDSDWPAQARRLMARVRHAVGDRVVRADHIGSTSVPGLPAKDLVDVQVVVRDLGDGRDVATHAHEMGLVHVAGAWDAPSRAGDRFREEVLVDADPGRPANVNLRALGDPVWRETLLFRDWLRADDRHRDAYLAEKRRLAAGTQHVDEYSDGKLDWIGDALGRAEDWAAAVGWTP